MPTENDYIDVRDLFVSINPHGLDQSELARDGASFVEPQTINDYYLFRAGYQAALEAQQGQGEPVAWLAKALKGALAGTLGFVRPYNRLNPDLYEGPFPVFRHADPAEVERLRADLESVQADRDAYGQNAIDLRAQLAEARALLARILGKRDPCPARYWFEEIEKVLSASAEPSVPNDCAICRDLGNQCTECEEGEFREWADRHFAAADYRKTDAGVFIQEWMRHAYSAWCARGTLASKQ
ncbi:hypothetical protein G7007_08045 [Pseudomonas entomophila]|uniref:hypothetical protein n=1 Tax=Pseudomonas entomophila TaxID=312306 RepID=UPI0015E276A3|nr:hypothetical protein [Pseudomonas entomophila]MBA1192809.1 hypothetical protein [Pseudomonas entomophila]